MATKKISKKLYYLRAFEYNGPLDLEQCLRQLLAIADNVSKTEIVRAGEVTQITHRDLAPTKADRGLLLHVEKGNQAESIKTIRHKSMNLTEEGDEISPPQDQSFMNRECFIFVFEQHVIFCGHNNMSQQALAAYLHALSEYCHSLDETCSVCKPSFRSVPNCDKIQMIQDEGVRSILAELTAYQATINNPPSLFGRLKGLFRKDDELSNIQDKADLQVNVEIKLDGNTRASLEAQKELCEQAQMVINEENSDFKIITQKGNTIKPDDVKLSKLVYIPKHNNTNGLSRIAALSELVSYFNELQKDNLTQL